MFPSLPRDFPFWIEEKNKRPCEGLANNPLASIFILYLIIIYKIIPHHFILGFYYFSASKFPKKRH